MNAPESKPDIQILPFPSPATVLPETGRALAAIVFTDAVGYSALMSRDELRAQRIMARDLASMRLVCEENGGQVLKSTGDGLLMIFGSAVRAVSCALEIQSRFRDQNRSLPFAERLSHRIGIHLGDVFRQENDVIGDGVNIASRLESIAWRGGVCVSGTVYEVVQNRLRFYVLSRKQQKLKNVGNIVAYQLAPVGGRLKYLFEVWNFLRLSDARVIKIILIVVSCVSVSLLVKNISINFGDFGAFEDPLHAYAMQLGRFGSVETGDDDDDDKLSQMFSTPPPATGKNAVGEDEFAIARFDDVKKYDFAAMGTWLAGNNVSGYETEKLRTVCGSLQGVFDWGRAHLKTYSEANPFVVRDGTDRVAYLFWAGPDGKMGCKLPATHVNLLSDEIPPSILAMMLGRLLEEEAPADDLESENLWRGLKFFTSVYQVDLPSALEKEMNHNAELAAEHGGKS